MRKIVLAGLLVMLAALAVVVHTLLPRYVERSLNGMIEHRPYAIDAETEALHRSLFVADLHTDSLLWKRDLATRSDYGHVDLPRLQAGNVALQVFSATTKSPSGQNYASNSGDSDNITALAVLQLWPPRTWRSLYERAAYQLERLKRLAHRSGGRLLLVRSREDIAELARRRAAGEPVTGAVYLI
ncbi:MAG: peptidase M19, partial [Pseudomonadota bacterium]